MRLRQPPPARRGAVRHREEPTVRPSPAAGRSYHMTRMPSTLDHAGNRNRAHRPLLRVGRLRVRRRQAHPGAVRCAATLRERRRARHRGRDRESRVRESRTSRTASPPQAISSAGSSTAPGRPCRPGASRRASSRSDSRGSPERVQSSARPDDALATVQAGPGGAFRVVMHPAGRDDKVDLPFTIVVV